MAFSKHSRLLVFTLSVLSVTIAVASAKFEQKLLSINQKDKKVTFTFYHFDSSKSVILADVSENVGDTAAKQHSNAAISASAITEFTYLSGKFVFPPTSNSYLIKDGAITDPATSLRSYKRTFILTDDKSRHALCYAPSVSETELDYALQQYLTTSKTKFTSAVLIHSGNQCGFYKTNGRYRPYYLKELKKPAKALLVK
jgi:hypothetical protein